MDYSDLTSRALESIRLKAFQPQIAADLADSSTRRRAAIAALTRYHTEWRGELARKESTAASERHSRLRDSAQPGIAATSISFKRGGGRFGKTSQRQQAPEAASGAQENLHLQTLLHMAQLEHASHVERLAEQASFAVHAGGASTASVSAASTLVPQSTAHKSDAESRAASILSTTSLVNMADRSDRISGALFARAFDSSASAAYVSAASAASGLASGATRATAPGPDSGRRSRAGSRSRGSPSQSPVLRSPSPAAAALQVANELAARGDAESGRAGLLHAVAPCHATAPQAVKEAYFGSGRKFHYSGAPGRSRATTSSSARRPSPRQNRRGTPAAQARGVPGEGQARGSGGGPAAVSRNMLRLRGIPHILPAYATAREAEVEAEAAAREAAEAKAAELAELRTPRHRPKHAASAFARPHTPSTGQKAVDALGARLDWEAHAKAASEVTSVSTRARGGGAATIGLLSAALGDRKDAAAEELEVAAAEAEWRGGSEAGQGRDGGLAAEQPAHVGIIPSHKGVSGVLERMLEGAHEDMAGRGSNSPPATSTKQVNYADLLGPRDMAAVEEEGGDGEGEEMQREVLLSADATSNGMQEDGSSAVPRPGDFNVKGYLRRMVAPDEAAVRSWTEVLLKHKSFRTGRELAALERELTPLVPWLQMLTRELRADVFEEGTAVLLEPGHTLFQQGDVGADFYIILNGTVDIEVTASKTTDARDLWKLQEATASQRAVPTLAQRRHNTGSDLTGRAMPSMAGAEDVGSGEARQSQGRLLSDDDEGRSTYKPPTGVTVCSTTLLSSARLVSRMGEGFEGKASPAAPPETTEQLRGAMGAKGKRGGPAKAPADSSGTVVINTLGAFDSFGEGALHSLSGAGERQASVVARDKCALLALKAAVYHRVMHAARIQLVDKATDALRRTAPFMAWPIPSLQRGLGLAQADIEALHAAEMARRAARDARRAKLMQADPSMPTLAADSDAPSHSQKDGTEGSADSAGVSAGGGEKEGPAEQAKASPAQLARMQSVRITSAAGAFLGSEADTSFLGKHAVPSRASGTRCSGTESKEATDPQADDKEGSDVERSSEFVGVAEGEAAADEGGEGGEGGEGATLLPHGIEWWKVVLGVTHLVYSPGEIIVPQGSPAHGFFIILLGHARVVRALPVPAQLAHGLVGISKLQGYNSYDAVLASPALQAMAKAEGAASSARQAGDLGAAAKATGARSQPAASTATLEGATLQGSASASGPSSSLASLVSAVSGQGQGVAASLSNVLAKEGAVKGTVHVQGGGAPAPLPEEVSPPGSVSLPVELMQLRPGDSFGWTDTLRTATEEELHHGPLYRAIWGGNKLQRALRKLKLTRKFGLTGASALKARVAKRQAEGARPSAAVAGAVADAMAAARRGDIPSAEDGKVNLGAVVGEDGMFRGAKGQEGSSMAQARAAVASFRPDIVSAAEDASSTPGSLRGLDAAEAHLQARYQFSLVAEERVEVLYFPREMAIRLANTMPQRSAGAYTAQARVTPTDEFILDKLTRWYNWDLYRLRSSFLLNTHPSVAVGPRQPRSAALVASARDLRADVAGLHTKDAGLGLKFQGQVVSSAKLVREAQARARHKAAMLGLVPSSGLGQGAPSSAAGEGEEEGPDADAISTGLTAVVDEVVAEKARGAAASPTASSPSHRRERSNLGGIGTNSPRSGGNHAIPALRAGLKFKVAPMEESALARSGKGTLSLFARRQVEASAVASVVRDGAGQDQAPSKQGSHTRSASSVPTGQLSPRNRSSLGSYVDTASHAAMYGESTLHSAHRIAGRASARHKRMLERVASSKDAGGLAAAAAERHRQHHPTSPTSPAMSPSSSARFTFTGTESKSSADHATTTARLPAKRGVRPGPPKLSQRAAGRKGGGVAKRAGRKQRAGKGGSAPVVPPLDLGFSGSSSDESPEIARLYKLYEINNFNTGKYLVSDAPHMLPLPVPAHLPEELFINSDGASDSSGESTSSSSASDTPSSSEHKAGGDAGTASPTGDAASDASSEVAAEEVGRDPVADIPYMHPDMVHGFYLVDPVQAGGGRTASAQHLQRRLKPQGSSTGTLERTPAPPGKAGRRSPRDVSQGAEDDSKPATADSAAGFVVANVRKEVRRRRRAAERSAKRAEREAKKRKEYQAEQARRAKALLGRAKGQGPDEAQEVPETAAERRRQAEERRAARLRRRARRRQKRLVKAARAAEAGADASGGLGGAKVRRGFRTVAEAVAEGAAEGMAELGDVGHISVGITSDRVSQPRLFAPPPTAPAAALLVPSLASAVVGAGQGQQNALQQLLATTNLATADGRPVTPCTATALSLVDPDSALASASSALGLDAARLRRAAERAYNPSGTAMAAMMVAVPSLKPIAPRSYLQWGKEAGTSALSDSRARRGRMTAMDARAKQRPAAVSAMARLRAGLPPPPPKDSPARPPQQPGSGKGKVNPAVASASQALRASKRALARDRSQLHTAHNSAISAQLLAQREELMIPGAFRRLQLRSGALASPVHVLRKRPAERRDHTLASGAASTRHSSRGGTMGGGLRMGGGGRVLGLGGAPVVDTSSKAHLRRGIVASLMSPSRRPEGSAASGPREGRGYLQAPKLWTATSGAALPTPDPPTQGLRGVLKGGGNRAEGDTPTPKRRRSVILSPALDGFGGRVIPGVAATEDGAVHGAGAAGGPSPAAQWSEYVAHRPAPYKAALMNLPDDARDVRYDAAIGAVVATVTREVAEGQLEPDVLVRMTMGGGAREAARARRRQSILAANRHVAAEQLDVAAIVQGRKARLVAGGGSPTASVSSEDEEAEGDAAGAAAADPAVARRMQDFTIIVSPSGGIVVPAVESEAQHILKPHTGAARRASTDASTTSPRRRRSSLMRRPRLASGTASLAGSSRHGGDTHRRQGEGTERVAQSEQAKWLSRVRPLIPGVTAPPADFIRQFLAEVDEGGPGASDPRVQLLARHWRRALYWRMPPQDVDAFLPQSVEEMEVLLSVEAQAHAAAEHAPWHRSGRVDLRSVVAGMPPVAAGLRAEPPLHHRPMSVVFGADSPRRGPPQALTAKAGKGGGSPRRSRRSSAGSVAGRSSPHSPGTDGGGGRGDASSGTGGEERSVTGDSHGSHAAATPGAESPRAAVQPPKGAPAVATADTKQPGRVIVPLPNPFIQFNSKHGRVMKTASYASQRRLEAAIAAEGKATATIQAVQAAQDAAAPGHRERRSSLREGGGRGAGPVRGGEAVLPEDLVVPAANETVWAGLTAGQAPPSPRPAVPEEAPGLDADSAGDDADSVDTYPAPPSDEEDEGRMRARRMRQEREDAERVRELGPVAALVGQSDVGRVGGVVVGAPRLMQAGGGRVRRRVYLTPAAKRRSERAREAAASTQSLAPFDPEDLSAGAEIALGAAFAESVGGGGGGGASGRGGASPLNRFRSASVEGR